MKMRNFAVELEGLSVSCGDEPLSGRCWSGKIERAESIIALSTYMVDQEELIRQVSRSQLLAQDADTEAREVRHDPAEEAHCWCRRQ